MDELLKVRGVSGGYHRRPVVRDISLEVRRGDFTGIIGPNGSGKTTLLRLLTRTLPVLSGRILFSGNDISSVPHKEFCRTAAVVGQDTFINFAFTVLEIVLMGRIPHLGRMQFETKKDYALAEEALEMTGALHLKDAMVNELSAGERQRVFVAKALAQQPELLFLDEPTSHLDIGHQIQVMDLLKRLNRGRGLSVVIVLHDLNLASAYCSRLILLAGGRVFKEGAPQEVLDYRTIEAVYKTVVVVKDDPLTRRPYVFLVPGEK